jgi:hypothetical protein
MCGAVEASAWRGASNEVTGSSSWIAQETPSIVVTAFKET